MNSTTKDRFFRLITGLIFIAFIIAIVIVNERENDTVNDDKTKVPVIYADKSPIKIAPEKEGGINIPFRKSAIYETVNSSNKNERAQVSLEKEDVIDETEVKFKESAKSDKNEKIGELAKSYENQRDLDGIIKSISESETTRVKKYKAESKKSTKNPFNSHRVQLGSLSSEAKAKKAWNYLKNKYSAALNDLNLHIEKASKDGRNFYRVQSNLISNSQAKQICKIIKNCLVVKAK